MKLGYSEVTICLDVPIQLGGYGVYREAKIYNNNLKTRTISILEKGKYYHIISIDILAIDIGIVERIKYEHPHDEVIICATHTHSGPAGIHDVSVVPLKSCEYFLGKQNRNTVNSITNSILKGIEESKMNLSTFELSYMNCTVNGVATNRNDVNLVADNQLTSLKFNLSNGKELLLFNYACHPTVLNSASTVLSGDLIESIINQTKSKFDFVSFLNGSAGDMSTRYTKKESSINEMDRLAKLVSKHLLDITEYSKPKPLEKIEITHASITLPLKSTEGREVIQNKLNRLLNINNLSLSETFEMEALKAELSYIDHSGGEKSIEVNMDILTLDELLFVFVPFEMTSELTNLLKEKYKNIRFVSYSNGCYMYLAPISSYDKNYYEAGNTSFMRGSGEVLVSYLDEYLSLILGD